MIGKGAKFWRSTFVGLLFVMVSAGLLHAVVWEGLLRDLNNIRLGEEDVIKLLTEAGDQEICGTTTVELLNFQEANCDLEEMTQDYFISPAEKPCCVLEDNEGLCFYLRRATERRIKKCEGVILPSLKTAWEKIAGEHKEIVKKFYSQLQKYEASIISKWTGAERKLYSMSKEYAPTCFVIIEELSNFLPHERAQRLGDHNDDIALWSNYLYACKKYVNEYCLKVDKRQEKCSVKGSKHSYLPTCGSGDLNNLVNQCKEIEVFV